VIILAVLIAAQVPILCVAIYFQYRDKEVWKAKFEALEAESKVVYQGHVDASFQKMVGRPLFKLRDENPQESGYKFELGADQVESHRLRDLADMPPEDYFTEEDELHIKQLEEVN